MIIYLVVTLALLVLGVLIRNQQVFRFRMNLSRRIFTQGMEEIYDQYQKFGQYDPTYKYRDNQWRYAEFDAVSYNRMVVQFWRPLRTFYKIDPARPNEMSDLPG
jgi:hypothetical protein